MSKETYNLLFLCTGNSARSIFAECITNRLGAPRFRAFSAGSHPTGTVNPYALRLLEKMNYPTGGLRSKEWAEFATEGAPAVVSQFELRNFTRAFDVDKPSQAGARIQRGALLRLNHHC